MPSGTYEFAECCPEGYTEIDSAEDCEAAYDILKATGENWGGVAVRDARPSGCFIWTGNKNWHFNSNNVNGNSMSGDDKVICKIDQSN